MGAPIDVLWFRLARTAQDPHQVVGRVDQGRFLVMLDRGDYWQCAFVIPKGEYDKIRDRGLGSFKQSIETMAPLLKGRTGEIESWEQVKLRTVRVDRLKEWARPGLLMIGDAAHAMSPVGGVGIN